MRTLAVVLFLALTIGTAHAQRGVRIGYIDTEYILENVNEYQNAQNQLEAKVQQWKIEVEQRLAELETQKTQLNNERVLLTNELIVEREEELQIIENEIIDYQQKRFGPNGDLMIQKKQLIQPIQDQIFAAVQEIATSKKYDFIFDKSADVVMLYSADRYDISEQVLRTINRTAKREQIKSKKERKGMYNSETGQYEDRGAVSDADYTIPEVEMEGLLSNFKWLGLRPQRLDITAGLRRNILPLTKDMDQTTDQKTLYFMHKWCAVPT